MQPIQPKIVAHLPPSSSSLRSLSPVQPQATDRVELSGLPLEVPDFAPASVKAPKSLVRRMVKWAGIAGLGVTAATSLLGGIAYQGNQQALVTPTVNVYPQQLEQSATPTLAQQVNRAGGASVGVAVAPSLAGVEILVPSGTVQQWMNSPELQAMISTQLGNAQGQIAQQIGLVKVPSGSVMLDVTLPMPSSNQSFLHVGGVNLPSLGYQALQSEPVPLQVSYRADTVETGLKVDMQQLREAPGQGPGVWLGGVTVTVSAPKGHIPVAGEVNLALDLQGKATQAQIDHLRTLPGQEKLISQLEGRLEQGQHLQKVIHDQGLAHVLEAGLNQNLDFQGQVVTGSGPLVKTTLNVWAVPDHNGDGKADLQVTQQNSLDNLKNLRVQLDQIGGDQAPSGTIGRFVHDQARKALVSNLEKQLPGLNQQIQQTALDQVTAQLRTQAGQIQAQANQQLGQVYGQNLTVPGLGSVNQVKVVPGGLLVEIPAQPGGDGVHLNPQTSLKAGQVAVGVDRASLNQQMQQRVNWDQVLAKAGGSGYQLSWAQDAQGQALHPELRSHDGKLFLHVEMVAHKNLAVGQQAGLLDNVNTAMDIPLQLSTDQGKLIVNPDLGGAQLQRLQAGGMDLSKLVPAKALTGLIGGQALGQTVDPSGWGGLHFDSVQVGPAGDLTVVVGTSPATVHWAGQALR